MTNPLEIPKSPDAEVMLPLPQGQALNSRSHWASRAKQTKEDRAYACFVGELLEVPTLKQAIVTITWRGRGRMPDVDNSAGRCKAYLDGLQDARWWDDDKDIVWLSCNRERIKKGEEAKLHIRAWRVDDVDSDAAVDEG